MRAELKFGEWMLDRFFMLCDVVELIVKRYAGTLTTVNTCLQVPGNRMMVCCGKDFTCL